jgi:alpha-beta hydrolase superfamily lysophospholipase
MENYNSDNGFFIKGKDGKDIFLYCWNRIENPKAVVQIFHGMAEHAGRYKEFAEFLNDKGFAVYADDHRGHGKTAGTVEELGCIDQDGFNKIVEDEYIINNYIREKHRDLPLFIFGHSFGSFVAQEYMLKHGKEVAGVVLCGSAAKTGPEINAGKIIAFIEKSIFGERRKSKLIDHLSFSTFNKGIPNSKSKFDWVSTDEEEVRKYETDPFCGTIFTAGFFYYFFKGLSSLYTRERLAQLPQKLPLYIIAGEEDPVGGYGVLVKKLHKIYTEAGLQNVSLKFYPGKRHEILKETNRAEVFSDVSDWLHTVLDGTF